MDYNKHDAESLRRPDGVILTPIKTIRRFCIECMGGSPYDIPKCTSPSCWLYPYRMGKHPTSKHKGNIGNLNKE